MKKTIEEVLFKATEGSAKMGSISQPKLQVLASTFPITENAGEVKEALEKYINEKPQWVQKFADPHTGQKRDCIHGNLARSCNICDMDRDIFDLKQQLATAEQTGYEPGVMEAAMCEVSVSPIRPNETSAGYQLRVRDDMQQSILNLLNKKGTE